MQRGYRIPLFVNYQGRRVLCGVLGPDKVFRKTVQAKQKLIVLDSYGIDAITVEDLKTLGCRAIELFEQDSGTKFTIDFATFQAKAIPRAIGKFTLRYYLPLRYWRRQGGGNVVLA